jgi:hypothetical protein
MVVGSFLVLSYKVVCKPIFEISNSIDRTVICSISYQECRLNIGTVTYLMICTLSLPLITRPEKSYLPILWLYLRSKILCLIPSSKMEMYLVGCSHAPILPNDDPGIVHSGMAYLDAGAPLGAFRHPTYLMSCFFNRRS